MTEDSTHAGWSRRRLLQAGSAGALAPALVRRAYGRGEGRPRVDWGSQVGDVRSDSALIWSRTDRDARMQLRWSTRPDLADAVHGPWVHALQDRDHTAKLLLNGLPAGERIYYEIVFTDLADLKTHSEPLRGSFRTAPASAERNVRFLWSGDTAGQGWGINPDFGGMRIYNSMHALQPDFFIHCGDTVYADSPIGESVQLPDGTSWRNLVTPEKSKVAESLDEFRGQFRYNLLDAPLRRFNAEVPMYAQWDDHEVTNNWYWELRRDNDPRYREGSVARLAARAMRAFQEYMPVRQHPLNPERIHDHFSHGPLLDVFRIDLRAWRGPNSDEQPRELSPEFRILGQAQMAWLKQSLRQSTATWKVIASSMPLGLVVYDNWEHARGAEAIALRDGPAAGRELEIAELLTFIRDEKIANVVWLTADVHYTAAHYYDPEKAQYPHFSPFWEFVSGPLNAGTFGPNPLDNTFGPQLIYRKAPEDGRVNLSPLEGMQFFGQVDIDTESRAMTVTLKDLEGETLFTQLLRPEGEMPTT
ncbi:MAG: alkaline phosphatase [Haliea sp.]|nr:alkaline phosphatase [Haliea sp.]